MFPISYEIPNDEDGKIDFIRKMGLGKNLHGQILSWFY
jgi:hypothetical protein